MFTVCPKCALTLVVTAQDLRVAQGYVRCGRCSNVFNAIVGLTDDRGALAGGGSQGTASTTITRKAPSIDDTPADALNDTSESEAIYAEPEEPDPEEVKFQEVFAEPTPSSPPPSSPLLDSEKRYSDTEGIETYPDSELEFNPAETDVTKVFVEAAPVAFKGDATGNFRRIVIGAEPPEEPDDEVFAPPPPASPPPAAPAPKAAATPTSSARPRVTAPPPPSPSPVTAAPSRPPAKPVASSTPPPRSAPPSRPPPPPPRDSEDQQIDSDLRSLAAKLGGTASRPAPKFLAANDEAIQRELSGDDNRDTGDIYAKAVPRPREPARPPAPATAQRFPARQNFSLVANDAIDDDEAEIQAVDGAAGTFTPARPPRSRVTLWISGAALLSLALVAQAVHHNRHDLATNALLNRPLVRFYRAIGVPLVPSWDLRSYDVRQLGASSSEGGDGTLTVRASLKNNAKQPLPLPLLRITMQDRYGNRIATRDVLPAGYVPGAVPAEAHLGVGQRIDAEMTFKDPGQSAVGFEIDACLATASGRIACANDAAVAAR